MAEKAVSFWRRLDWRLWSRSYLEETPETERVAWVRPYGKGPGTPAEDERHPAQVRDISLGGIVIVVNRRFESGTLLRVEVPAVGDAPATAVLARVIQVTALSQRAFSLNCCYAKELNDDDLRAFGAERARPQGKDGREWVRYDCETDTWFICVLAAEHVQEPTKIRNISAGGFAIQTKRPLDVSTLLSVALPDPNGPPRPTLSRVIHVAAQGDGTWLLGCTFVTELSDADLEALM